MEIDTKQKKVEIDPRQASIVYQNQSHLAFEILKYNSEVRRSLLPEDSNRLQALELLKICPKEVVELALKLTMIAVNPVPHMKTKESK